MIRNRKSSRVGKGTSRFLVRLWQIRFAFPLAIAYGILFVWLFVGTGKVMNRRPVDFSEISGNPSWEAPSSEHRFGTTADGEDLYLLCRAAMAQGSAFAVIVVLLGSLFALLISLLFVFDGGSRSGAHFRDRFTLLRVGSRWIGSIPAFLVLCIILGGSGGGPILFLVAFTIVVGFYSCETVAQWFEREDRRSDRIAGEVLGLHRALLIKSRSIPAILPQLIGLAASLLPMILLAEMALAFIGFNGGLLSCGSIVSSGSGALLEAPWVTIYPGLFAGFVVLLFSILGRLTNHLLRGGKTPDFI